MQKTIHRQEEAVHFARAFGDDAYHIMVWAGPSGLSKTRTIEDVLGKANIVYLSGEVSPYQLYKDVYSSREVGKIVIDDVETLIRNPLGTQLLKAFCQTEEVKVVGWHKATRDLAKDGIPRQYETSARFCLVCNDEDAIKKHLGPVIDRGVLVRFRYPAEEVHRMVGRWLHVNKIDREVYDFIGDHLAFAKVPSARLYKTATDTKISNPGIDWREAVLETFGLDEDEVAVARLFSDPNFGTNATRWAEFVRRGFGSRAKYYRIARDLKLIGKRAEGDPADGPSIHDSPTGSAIDGTEILAALGFGRQESRSPERRRPGQAAEVKELDDTDPSDLLHGSGKYFRPGSSYVIVVRKRDRLLYPVKFVRADAREQIREYANGLDLEPGASIEEIVGMVPSEGESVVDLRKGHRTREVG